HGYVLASGEPGHRVAPAGELADRKPRVVDHDRRAWIVACQSRRLVHLRVRRLQFEVQSERREAREAGTPARVVHLSGSGLMAHAADEGPARMRLEHRGAIVAIEPRLRHGNGGKA